MSWADDIASLDVDVFGSDGFGEPVVWPNGSTGSAVISTRQDLRIYETNVSEPIWMISFRRIDCAPVRGQTITARNAQWRFGERIDSADDYMDAWSIQKL